MHLEYSYAIFEFGCSFYGNTYTSMLLGLTLTLGHCSSFVMASNGKLGGPGNKADLRTATSFKLVEVLVYEKSPVWVGWLMIVNYSSQ